MLWSTHSAATRRTAATRFARTNWASGSPPSSRDWQRREQDLKPGVDTLSDNGGRLTAQERDRLFLALRELEEELGIDRFRSLLLGQLSPLYLFGTNFLITPWVAAVRDAVEFLPNREEVDEFLQVPLAHLVAPASRGEHIQQRGSLRFMAPHFLWRQHVVWGATSMILAELVAVVRDVRI